MSYGVQELLRPRGIHEPEGDPGMLLLWDTLRRCARCGWEGVPTCRGGNPLLECPRCQSAPELYDAEIGLELEHLPRWLNFTPPYRPRRVLSGRSGEAWRRRGVATVSKLGVRAVEEKVSRNAPCPCGSGKKFKKCCGA